MPNSDHNQELAELIERWGRGDDSVREALFRHLSPLLQRVARQQLQRHGRLLSLESTDLANETSLKLIKLTTRPENRVHLIRLMAKMMRMACIDLARERQASKRRGQRVSLSFLDYETEQPVDLMELDQALTALEQKDGVAAHVTELRFFGGLSEQETADLLQVSRATVTRKWKLARLFLARSLSA